MAEKEVARLPAINFPEQDPLWQDTLSITRALSRGNRRVLAPHEFCSQLPSAEPLPWSYWKPMTDYDVVVLHKDRLEQLSNTFLLDLENYDYVFGNQVFLIYVNPALNSKKLRGNAIHFSIHEALKRLKSFVKSHLKSKPHSGKQTFLLVTANHCGNLGDDIITLTAQKLLQEKFPDAQVIVDFPPVSKKQLRGVDAVFLGGGGLLYDSCFQNAINYSTYFLAAQELDIPTFSLGIGTQGIHTEMGKELFKRALDGSRSLMVRDNLCRETLEDKVRTTAPVTVKADTAFAMPLDGKATYLQKTDKPLLLYSLLDLERFSPALIARQYQRIARDCLPMLMQDFEVVIVTQSRDDLPFYQSLASQHNVSILEPRYEDALDMLGLYKQADLVITSRFHALIQSLLTQCPVISVNSNGSKAHRLIANHVPSALDSYLWIRDFSVESLQAKIRQFKRGDISLIANQEEVEKCRRAAFSMMDEVEKILTTENRLHG